MCRLLHIRSDSEFNVQEYLEKFALTAKNSKEYQGHGWGCSYLVNGDWHHYKSIIPVWEDNLSKFGNTNLIIAHARSAFKDEGITVENNMPFYDDRYIFIFNGELRGVKIKSEGRIGAEKIFNYIKRFDKGNINDAISKGTEIIKKKTSYIRAMNIIMCDKEDSYVYSLFSEDPDYFTMQYKALGENGFVMSSVKLDDEGEWKAIENDTLRKFCLPQNL